jgi:hypothetical protein
MGANGATAMAEAEAVPELINGAGPVVSLTL